MLYVYPTPQYPRTTLEASVKSLYGLTNAVTGIAMIVLITEFAVFLGNCMPEFFTNSDLVLSPGLQYVLDGCTYTGEIRLMGVGATVTVTAEGISLGLMQCAQYILALCCLLFVTIMGNGISLSLYRAGDRHIRVWGVHVPVYHGMVSFMYIINFTTIGTTFSYNTQRLFFEEAVHYCTERAKKNDYEGFLNSEFSGYTILSTAVWWAISAACANLCIFIVAFIIRCYMSYNKADILLSEADVPWEKRGFSCSTSKPLLRLHTTQRNAIVEEANAAMKEGMEVRIVRSYQLVTEEDYQELVTAMREQVEETIKDEQFEILRQNFGEDVNTWDQSGFMWRDDLPWALPTPLDSAEEAEETEVDMPSGAAEGFYGEGEDGNVEGPNDVWREDGEGAEVDEEYDDGNAVEEEAEAEWASHLHRPHRHRRRHFRSYEAEPLEDPEEGYPFEEGEELMEANEMHHRRRRRRVYEENEADELSGDF